MGGVSEISSTNKVKGGVGESLEITGWVPNPHLVAYLFVI